jgi:hypothetical protein
MRDSGACSQLSTALLPGPPVERRADGLSGTAWGVAAGRAPRPRVSSEPICTLFIACEFSSACASVLAAQNSTPWQGCGVSGFRLRLARRVRAWGQEADDYAPAGRC